MSRKAREKSSKSMYHVICRSISEVNLFEYDDDKDYYLQLLKKYSDKKHCSIYAYCIMSNHVHLFINPKGFDISSFMLSLNTSYAQYFNKKHQRHGHLFQGRFLSKIVKNDIYLLTLSAYIHNNAKDIPGYDGKEEYYKYSSYGIYLGTIKDNLNLVDTGFILNMFSENPGLAATKFRSFVRSLKDTGIMTDMDENVKSKYLINEYKSEKTHITRDLNADDVVRKTVYTLLGKVDADIIRVKNKRNYCKVRAMIVFLLRTYSGFTYKNICQYIGNITLSGVARLYNKGFELFQEDRQYRLVLDSLLE